MLLISTKKTFALLSLNSPDLTARDTEPCPVTDVNGAEAAVIDAEAHVTHEPATRLWEHHCLWLALLDDGRSIMLLLAVEDKIVARVTTVGYLVLHVTHDKVMEK